MAIQPIPQGYTGVTPYLVVKDAVRALDFYQKVFGGKQVLCLDYPDGRVAHAEVRIGDGHVMLSEEMESYGQKSPATLGGNSISLLVYVPDVDAVFARAVAAGATATRPVADQFYGDRTGTITDPFGHVWSIATHVRDMTQDEMQKAMETMMQQSQ